MTFEDEIKYYFSNWSIGDVSLDDFKSGKYKNAEDLMEKIFLNDFKKNYLNGNDMPQFIKNSNAYENIDLGSLQVWSGCLYIQFGVRNESLLP